MTRSDSKPWAAGPVGGVVEEAVGLLIGAGFTLVLFLLMSHYGRNSPVQTVAPIEELRSVTIPLEIPPPAISPETQPASEADTGIEMLPAPTSPVHLAIRVPILDHMPVPAAPPARIQVAKLYTEFKPRMDLGDDTQRIYQQSEVDQRPAPLVRSTPVVPPWVRQKAEALRMVLLIVIDTEGVVKSTRVLNGSGNEQFDSIVAKCVQDEWVFSPAMRKGRKVKCLVQQALTMKWSSRPFEN